MKTAMKEKSFEQQAKEYAACAIGNIREMVEAMEHAGECDGEVECDLCQDLRHEEQEREDRLDCQGVCKDCGAGSLNNRLHEAFDYNGNEVYCLNCGSTHLDLT